MYESLKLLVTVKDKFYFYCIDKYLINVFTWILLSNIILGTNYMSRDSLDIRVPLVVVIDLDSLSDYLHLITTRSSLLLILSYPCIVIIDFVISYVKSIGFVLIRHWSNLFRNCLIKLPVRYKFLYWVDRAMTWSPTGLFNAHLTHEMSLKISLGNIIMFWVWFCSGTLVGVHFLYSYFSMFLWYSIYERYACYSTK